MVEMFREFTFEAAHRVPSYSEIHGHSFQVGVVLCGPTDATNGWVMSLTDIEPHIKTVQRQLDHKYLNDIEGLAVPSLENVARWIWNKLDNSIPHLDRVEIRRGASGHGEGCVYRGRMAA